MERLVWWKAVAAYLHIPHNLDGLFTKKFPGDLHRAFHDLANPAELRCLSEITESWEDKWAAEMIHEELARRIAFAKGSGISEKKRIKSHAKLYGGL